MVKVRTAGISLVGASLLAACSLMTSLDGLQADHSWIDASSSEVAAGDGAGGVEAGDSPDGPSDGSSLDARDDSGPPNIHPFGTFESGCYPWSSYGGTVSESSVARSGVGSCRVCTNDTTTQPFSIDDNGSPGPTVVGATYRVEGWARTAPGSPAPAAASMLLRNVSPTAILEVAGSQERPLTAEWQRFESTLTVAHPGGAINALFFGVYRPSACFLVDDVVLRRIQ